jgi:predicted nucleotidyltransferase
MAIGLNHLHKIQPIYEDEAFTDNKLFQYSCKMDLEIRYLDMIKRTCDSALVGSGAQVILFGSRARGDATYASDVDLAIKPPHSVASARAALKDQLEESMIPYRCDVVDLAESDEALKKEVEREGVVIWSD